MRVLAAAVAGASAVSATATYTVKNTGAPTALADAAAERTASMTRCLTQIKDALATNGGTASVAALTPTPSPSPAAAIAVADVDTIPLTANLLGQYGGLCHDSTSATPASVATASPDLTEATYSKAVPASAQMIACAMLSGGSVTDGASNSVAGGLMAAKNMKSLFGGCENLSTASKGLGANSGADGQCASESFGTLGIRHEGLETSNLKGGTAAQDGADSEILGAFLGVNGGSAPTTVTHGKAAWQSDTNLKGLTGDVVSKLLDTQLGACRTLFLQEETLGISWTPKVTTAGSLAAEVIGRVTEANVESAQALLNRRMGFLNVNYLFRSLLATVYNDAFKSAVLAPSAHHPSLANTLAIPLTSGSVKLANADKKDGACSAAVVGLWSINEAFRLMNTDGTGKTKVRSTDLYQCWSQTTQGDPCTAEDYDAGLWGDWADTQGGAHTDATFYSNKWGVPNHDMGSDLALAGTGATGKGTPAVCGSKLFSCGYREVVVPAHATNYGADTVQCNTFLAKADAAGNLPAHSHRCKINSVPAGLASLSESITDGVIVEVKAGTGDSSAGMLGTTAPTNAATAQTALRKDFVAGVTLIIIGGPETWTYTASSDLDPSSEAATNCGGVRTHMAKILDNRCDVAPALFNTRYAGSLHRVFTIAYGTATGGKSLHSSGKVVPDSLLGLFGQLAKSCGFAKGTKTDDSKNPNCTDANGANTTTWDNYKKDAKNKCTKSSTTNGAWSRFGAFAFTAVLAAFAF